MSSNDHGEGEPITSPRALEALIADLRAAGRFALDTEFVSEETFEPVLCLIQIATRTRIAAIDATAFDDLTSFWDLVCDPSVEVVMHAAGEDLRICKLRAGRVPTRVVDVQIAAGLVGFGYPVSLTSLISQVLGVTVEGGETRTDWRRRPLTAAQVRYALDDVRYLLDIADEFERRLDSLDRRGWAEAEYQSAIDEQARRDDSERWRRIPGLGRLNRRGLEAARRLAAWRRERAQRVNRPLRQSLRDDLLVAIAKRMPRNRRDLEALREFNRAPLRAHADELLEQINAAARVRDEDLPEPLERRDARISSAMVVDVLAAALAWCCTNSKVAVGLTGTHSDLRELALWHVEGRRPDRVPALLHGWRAEVCGRTLLDVISGRVALRIGDIEGDVPIEVVPIIMEEAADS